MPKKNKNIPYSSYEGKEISFEQIKKGDLIKIYYKILNSYPERESNTRVNEIILKHKIAQQYSKSGRNEEALDLCNQILSINNFSAFAQEKLEERLQRVSKLRSELMNQE